MGDSIWLVLGVGGFLFRLWLCEIRLEAELGSKRGHSSRYVSYYFFLAMMLGFEANVFTLIALVSAPVMLMAFFFFDLPYYFGECLHPFPRRGWLILERLTLHPPVVVFAVLFYLRAPLLLYFQLFHFIPFLCALILGLTPLFLFDPRVTRKEDFPNGIIILTGTLIDILGNLAFVGFLAVKWQYFRFFP